MKVILSVLGILALVILVVVLLVTNHGPSTPKDKVNLLSDKYKNSVVQVTMEGPVNALENHDSVRISVSPNVRTVQSLQGYEYTVQQDKEYNNTQASYDAFVQALTTAGFTQKNTNSTKTSMYSICPDGDRYVYEIFQGGQPVFRAWSTSCGNQGAGTFQGDGPEIRNLFKRQIPDYDTVVGSLGF